jgi:phage shock protein PspC (stress-responsive transcriptional regulator)
MAQQEQNTMSAYYSHRNAQMNAVYETFQRPRRVICGVCAALAEQSAVPAWIIRIVAVCMLIAHTALAVIVYLCAAAFMRRPAAGTWRDLRADPCGAGPLSPPPSWDRDGLVGRFDSLNSRLAQMEREAMDREVGLRRAFRDLDR